MPVKRAAEERKRQSGGQPVVILTKADLSPDYEASVADVYQSVPDIIVVHKVPS